MIKNFYCRLPIILSASVFLTAGHIFCQDWKEVKSEKFNIYYQKDMPATFPIEIKSAYLKAKTALQLRIDEENQRPAQIYLYQSKKDLASAAIFSAMDAKGAYIHKTNAVYTFVSGQYFELTPIVLSGLIHLYVQNYFMEKEFFPPKWLEFGIESFITDRQLNSIWSYKEKYYGKKDFFSFNKILAEGPDGLDEKEKDIWLTQAFSLVKFLSLRGSPVLAEFCQTFRDTRDLQKALEKHYGYDNLDEFEKAWRNSIKRNSSLLQDHNIEKEFFSTLRPERIQANFYGSFIPKMRMSKLELEKIKPWRADVKSTISLPTITTLEQLMQEGKPYPEEEPLNQPLRNEEKIETKTVKTVVKKRRTMGKAVQMPKSEK